MQIDEAPDLALNMLESTLEERTNSAGNNFGNADLLPVAYLLSAIGDAFGNDTVEPKVSEVSCESLALQTTYCMD